MARRKISRLPKKYSTTEAARSSMPRNVEALEEIRDNAKSEIAKVQAVALLAKLAKLDQIPEVQDVAIECVPITSENGKVVPISAGKISTNSRAN